MSLFDGDGRAMICAPLSPTQIVPLRALAVRRGTAKRLIQNFERTGESHHGALGQTLWIIETWCLEQQYRYSVTRTVIDGETCGWRVKKET